MGNYLLDRRLALGLTQKEVAQRVGVTAATVSRWESGNIANMRRDRIYSLAQVLRCSPAYIMTGDGVDAPLPSNVLPMPKTYKIPLLGDIACGTPILAAANLEGSVEVPDNIRADFSLQCKGDSMINARIHDGDIVYIRQQEDIEDGEIAAVLVDDAATLKRVKRIGTYIALQPCNDNYQDIIIDTTKETVRILGKAVGFTSVL